MTDSRPAPGARPDPPTIRLRSPEDVLAAVPVLLGFAPADSVVLLTAGAERPFHARIDLPHRRESLPGLVDALVAPVRRHRPGAVVLVVYSDDEAVARRAWLALRDGFDAAGVRVVEALRTDGRRYHPYLARDRRLRSDGVAYDVSGHPFLAEAVLAGKVLRASRADLVATLDPDAAATARVAVLLADRRVDPAGPGPREPDPHEAVWLRRAVRRWRSTGVPPGDDDVARFAAALRCEALRDVVRCPITRASAADHVELLTHVVRRTPASHVAGPAAVLAWAAWQSGDGALAWAAVDRCTAVEPDHPLGDLVARLLQHAVPPDAPTPGEAA